MSAEISEINTLDPDNDFKQIRVEDKFIEAYVDRYMRLGYREAGRSEEKADGKNYAEVIMQRDRSQPNYSRLCEIEKEIGEIISGISAGDVKDGKKNRLRIILRIMFFAGIAVGVAGIVMLICGFLNNLMAIALGGWAVVIFGAAAIIVWSFLRENWRLRKIDEEDDREHPGFGVDEASKRVEEKLREADILRGEKPAEKKA
ncbi:MAG: DUF3040 domain-containing protein [Clostridia bacterium]|nr:DUF3040 domain-containing protein [Clostridia bacterium]